MSESDAQNGSNKRTKAVPPGLSRLAKALASLTVSMLLSNVLGCAGSASKSSEYPSYWVKLPKSQENNIWYEKNNSDTVVVFVHGIFSDNRNAWAYVDSKNGLNSQYWPELIERDLRLERPAIFLGGYFTSLDSGPYDTAQAAGELRDAIKREKVLEKQNIIFIAHSTGGIVSRYLLVHNQELFRGKRIGLVLYASPSTGAAWANRFHFLTTFYGNKLAADLQEDSPRLTELDNDFKNLLYDPNSDPESLKIMGAEGVENFFILHRRLLPDKITVVPADSASRYFGAPRYLRQTDHFSIVKPNNERHPAHELLIEFYEKFTKPLTVNLSPQPIGQVANLWKGDSRLRLRLMPGKKYGVLNNLLIGPASGTKLELIREWCSQNQARGCVNCDPHEQAVDTVEVQVWLKDTARVEKRQFQGQWPVPQPGMKLEPWQLVNPRGERFYYECKSE
jgi:pimeloyl-ACP methyl ester carboxylesterase